MRRLARSSAWAAVVAMLVLSPSFAARGQDRETDAEVAASPLRFTAVRDGVRIEAEIERLAEDPGGSLEEQDPVAVRFRLTDAATGSPLTGLFPAAWMDRIPDAASEEGPKACEEKVEGFAGGSLLAVPEVDLNVYYVLTLNADASISVVDPLFGFGGSKLLGLIQLPSPGEDGALAPGGERLFASLPATGEVAVIDTAVWKVVDSIPVGGRPTRLVLQPDGRRLWVIDAAPEARGILSVDLENPGLVRVPTGPGTVDLAASDDSRYLFVANRKAGTVSVIDVPSLSRSAEVAVGPRPVSIAYSASAAAAFVTDEEDGTVRVIDGPSGRQVARIDAEPGLGRIAFAPDDRFAFVVNPDEDLVHVIDAARGRIVKTGDMEARPDRVAFSDELAYVRHLESETVYMIPLKQIGQPGPLPVIDFPGGQLPFGAVTEPALAHGIVQAPGATAVLVANPGDQMVYYYKEGMAAPMGSFRNYGRQPRAVLVVDRSLDDAEDGVYRTAVSLGRPGRYDLAFFLDSPRFAHCFQFAVGPNAELEQRRLAALGALVEYLDPVGEIPVGEVAEVRFRLLDPIRGTPVADAVDVQVLTFLVPGVWQDRQWAEHLGDGVYRIRFRPKEEGIYRSQVAAPSLRLKINRSASLSQRAVAPRDVAPRDVGAAAPFETAQPIETGGVR